MQCTNTRHADLLPDVGGGNSNVALNHSEKDVTLSDCVQPGDSASQNGSALTSLDLESCGFGNTVLSAENYLAVLREAGPDVAARVLEFYGTQQQFFMKCVSAHFGENRMIAKTMSNASSTTTGSSGTGVVAKRTRSLAGVSKRVKFSGGRPRRVPDGLCYTKALSPNSLEEVASRLGEWPSVASLLRTPADKYMSLGDLSRFRLVGDSQMLHLRAGGSEGYSFCSTLGSVAKLSRFPIGSFGAVLAAAGGTGRVMPNVSLRSVVGGGSHATSLRSDYARMLRWDSKYVDQGDCLDVFLGLRVTSNDVTRRICEQYITDGRVFDHLLRSQTAMPAGSGAISSFMGKVFGEEVLEQATATQLYEFYYGFLGYSACLLGMSEATTMVFEVLRKRFAYGDTVSVKMPAYLESLARANKLAK